MALNDLDETKRMIGERVVFKVVQLIARPYNNAFLILAYVVVDEAGIKNPFAQVLSMN